MYTILVTPQNELITTIPERIMHRSKLVNSFRFLVSPMWNGFDMSKFSVALEYVLPVSGYTFEYLTLSSELYKGMLEYVLPIDTKLTKEVGNIELSLTFTLVETDDSGNQVSRVRKTSATTLPIYPTKKWSDYIPDSDLSPLDQRLIKQDAQTKALEELVERLEMAQIAGLKLNPDTNELYLVDHSNESVGEKVDLNDLAEELADTFDDGMIKVVT